MIKLSTINIIMCITLSLSYSNLTHAEQTTIITPSTEIQNGIKDIEVTDLKPSLAAARMPSEVALSEANQKLLTDNARLEREVNDLQTQVNVLVNERSGQLFLYGVITALGSFFIGGLMSWFFIGRRKGW